MKVELKNITEELKKAIQNKIAKDGISNRQFAISCDIHPLQLNAFLKGEAGINIKTVEKIAEFIDG